MELFSHQFKLEVEDLFKNSPGCVVATIPLRCEQMPTIELLKKNPLSKVFVVSLISFVLTRNYYIFYFQVSKENRDTLVNEIVNYITM